jgi:DNA-binding NtrC family response regulator
LSAKRTGKKLVGFSNKTLGLLLNYGYPGNVRELENIIERATALAKGDQIEPDDLPHDLKDFNPCSGVNFFIYLNLC